MSPTSFLKYVWQPLLKAAGLPYRKPHRLRHTDASLMIQHGVNLVYVKEQLGHASIKMTVDTYGHLIPGAKKMPWISLTIEHITSASPRRQSSPRHPDTGGCI